MSKSRKYLGIIWESVRTTKYCNTFVFRQSWWIFRIFLPATISTILMQKLYFSLLVSKILCPRNYLIHSLFSLNFPNFVRGISKTFCPLKYSINWQEHAYHGSKWFPLVFEKPQKYHMTQTFLVCPHHHLHKCIRFWAQNFLSDRKNVMIWFYPH